MALPHHRDHSNSEHDIKAQKPSSTLLGPLLPPRQRHKSIPRIALATNQRREHRPPTAPIRMKHRMIAIDRNIQPPRRREPARARSTFTSESQVTLV